MFREALVLYLRVDLVYFSQKVEFLAPGTTLKPRQDVINKTAKPMFHRLKLKCKSNPDVSKPLSH